VLLELSYIVLLSLFTLGTRSGGCPRRRVTAVGRCSPAVESAAVFRHTARYWTRPRDRRRPR